MKIWIPIFAAITLLASCKEENNLIDYSVPPPHTIQDSTAKDSAYISDSIPAAQDKNVLIEDLTGDQCPNCPNAAYKAEVISSGHPGRIFIIAEHSGQLAEPNPGQKYRFVCSESTNLLNILGVPSGYPMGAVDRTLFTGESNMEVVYQNWPGHVTSELGLGTPVNITFSKKQYDPATHQLNLQMKTVFTQALTSPVYLTVAVTESGMVDIQKTPTGTNSAYVFQHVMHQTVTPYNGKQLGTANPEKGRTYITNLSAIVNPWVSADSCSLVAFVHYRGNGPTDNQKVLQVSGTSMTK